MFKELFTEAIKYKKGKSYQSRDGWTVYVNADMSGLSIKVNDSAGWDLKDNQFILQDAGKTRATVPFKEGNIQKLADELYNKNDKTTWGETQGFSSKDYADIIRVYIDMSKGK